ncbi:hypothetical protein MTO96_051727 [Rhipicephalus appendiculatus]
MFNYSLLVLLCWAFVATQVPDFFEKCTKPEEEPEQGLCAMMAENRLGAEYYRHLAHKALEMAGTQPEKGNLNTLLDITRASTHEGVEGLTWRIEFTTVESVCNSSVAYFEYVCPPRGKEANGLCRAIIWRHDELEIPYAKCSPLA